MRQKVLSLAILILSIEAFFYSNTFAQAGPGGVSTEIVGNSNLKIWLDAGEISASDNTTIGSWPDISLSAINNSPTQGNVTSQPIYRSSISAGINGKPVVRFAGNKYFSFASSNDINQNGPYTERSTFLVFKTGSDITTRQILYEQGGNVRGLNIFIVNDSLYLGGYDFQVDGADGTPSWGFSAARKELQTNTTYVVSHLFNGSLGATTGTITGYLDGQVFAINAANIGSLFTHPDAPGLGAQTASTVMENGVSSGTGSNPFLGDFAEFISYESLLNNAERIIIENYLGAKYSANTITNDKYSHQLNYGFEVIGIGQEVGATNRHNTSKGRNLFQIEANVNSFDNNKFFMVGHNNADATSYTTIGAPNAGLNTQRIAREWHVDHTGNLDSITFSIDAANLPTPPSGYSVYYLAVDESGGISGNFNSSQTTIIQLKNTSGTTYEGKAMVPDNSFITLGVISAEVSFENSSFQKFETDATFTDSVQVNLNFVPAENYSVDYSISANTATFPGDIDNFSPTNTLVFNKDKQTAFIKFEITGDVSPESVEDFSLTLNSGGNTTLGLNIGTTNSTTVQINDNDNPPKFGFTNATQFVNENAGTINIEVTRSNSLVQNCSVGVRLKQIGGSGTATENSDYTYSSTTLNFLTTEATKSASLTITDDNLFESSETIILELFDAVDGDIISANSNTTITITDNDTQPNVSFISSSSTSPESNGNPSIPIKLSAISSQIVSVDYTISGASTATNAIDYSAATSGIINIPAGDSIAYFPITIVADGITESDETVIITLANNGNLANATLGSTLTYTLTLQDYVEFEFEGTGGVGAAVDNIIWLDANNLSGAHNSSVATFSDRSPNGNNATATNAGTLQVTSNLINNKKVVRFDGVNDSYTMTNSADINTNGPYDSKHIFMVIKTGSNVTNTQILCEFGGTTNGISLYLQGGQITFNPYNTGNNDGGATTPWGGTGGATKAVTGGTILTNTTYIISAIYNYNATNKVELFINGASVGTPQTTGVGRLFNHTGAINIGGAAAGETNLSTGTNAASYFGGDIAELIYYNDAPIGDVRKRIIENYLAGKFNVSITNQYYSYGATNSNNVIGIGKTTGSDYHLKSKGAGVLTIENPSNVGNSEFTFIGHNDSTMTWSTLNTPTSYIANSGERLKRVWRVAETGDLGNYTLSFDLSGATNGQSTDYELLIDTDGDFTNATAYTGGLSFNQSTNTLSFTNVSLANGNYFTLGTVIDDITTVQTGNWNSTSTWNCGCIPTGGNQVYLDHTVNVTSNQSAGNVIVNVGGGLNFPNAVTLSISGNLTLNGSITSNLGGLEFNGTSAQTITSTSNYSLNNLILNNALGLTFSGSQLVDLTGSLTINQGTLTTNNNLTLKSTSSKTARIATITSGSITGNVTIEQYMQSIQGWRDVTSTVSGATLQDWNDDIFTSGFPGSDVPSNPFVSIYTYDEDSLGDGSKGYRKATNITNPIEQGKGYHVYTLGGKTLDLTGPVYQGNINLPVTYTDDPGQAISQDGWNLVGNPYPCPVDWLSGNWVKTNLSDEFHIWDPQNQNYQSFVSGVGTNGGTRYIPAGMSFFVKADGGGVPVLTIQEGTKVDLAIPFIKNSSANKLFRIKSFFNDKSDEIAIIQNPFASPYYTSGEDALKVNSFSTENAFVSSFGDEGFELSINSFNLNSDSVYFPLKINGDSISITNTVNKNNTYLLVNQQNEIIDKTSNGLLNISFDKPLSGIYTLMSENLYTPNNPNGIEQKLPENLQITQNGSVLTINSNFGISKIEVYDLSGKIVEILNPNAISYNLNLNKYPTFCLFKVYDNNLNFEVKKVVHINN